MTKIFNFAGKKILRSKCKWGKNNWQTSGFT